MVCTGDDENFTHRPGILHLHKSVTVDAFCVVFRDAHRHKAHFVLNLSEQHRWHASRKLTAWGLAVNHTVLPFKLSFQNRKITTNAGWLVARLCARARLRRLYLVTLLTCILSCKLYLRKASKKELLIIHQRGVMQLKCGLSAVLILPVPVPVGSPPWI